ncbi:hypothetical protein Mam01_35290 [Microbispora amethystogenes]|uniref:Uncharacterized protein n=2 Tax=Microbispora amethystogenes TaxID=1427754 RepID=A0ABQ4FEW3_9ACTN|nr:hypothetical protein Mam01_35290 [Microbispora amethystogenes]
MTMNLLESPPDHAGHAGHAARIDEVPAGRQDGGVAAFAPVAPRLLAIGLRVLHDAGEAEDVVQETWLRWARADRSAVARPPAYLALTATRLALNVAQCARRRRETAAGPWLPETADPSAGPETAAERHEEVGAAIRLLLERLTPAERAVYLLRIAFDYPYRRISQILHLGEDHARQLLRRAHGHLAGGRRRHPVSPAAHGRLVRTFTAAARTGDLGELEELLAGEVA